MTISFDGDFKQALLLILDTITSDKISAAVKFQKELYAKISLLKEQPYMHRRSIYFSDDSYRDMVHYGYTITYRVIDKRILVLEIFKWIDR